MMLLVFPACSQLVASTSRNLTQPHANFRCRAVCAGNRPPSNPQVVGSSPTGGAFVAPVWRAAAIGSPRRDVAAEAHTAFNGFAVLASLLGRDHYLPHQLAHRGDRLQPNASAERATLASGSHDRR